MAQKKVTDIKEVDKSKQLDSALGQIERQFGAGTVMRMGDKEHVKIPTKFEGVFDRLEGKIKVVVKYKTSEYYIHYDPSILCNKSSSSSNNDKLMAS